MLTRDKTAVYYRVCVVYFDEYVVAGAPVCPPDVVFVLDDSGSIGSVNFVLAKTFLSRLVARLNVGGCVTRIGLVKYSDNVNAHIYLNTYSSVASLQRAILALNYTGEGTYTASALAYVRTTILTSARGDRSNVSNVVVVLTDGKSSSTTNTRVSI